MNWNIITPADVETSPEAAIEPFSTSTKSNVFELQVEKGVRTTGAGHPGKDTTALVKKKPPVPGKESHQAADEWQDRLLKFIPLEAVGLYLGIDGALRSAQFSEVMEKRVWFGLALGVTLLFTALYVRLKKKVKRLSQLSASLAAVLVWVFAMGGIFATFPFYHPWQGTVVLGIGTCFLSLLQLEPLEKR